MAQSSLKRKKAALVAVSIHDIDRRTFWAQTVALTRANLKSRYRKTIAGFLWVVMNPLIMFGAQSYAFSHVLKIQLADYPRFLLSGLLPWIFISQSLEMCTSIFLNSGRLLKSFPLHPMVFLCAQLLDNLINFIAAFFLILLPFFIYNPRNAVGLLFLPVALLLLTGGVLGLSWLLAICQVFFRDTRFVMNFALSVAFYLTPIFYPVEFVPENYRWLVYYNPLYRLILPFQTSVYDFSGPKFLSAAGVAAGVAVGSLLLASWVWKRKRNQVYLNV